MQKKRFCEVCLEEKASYRCSLCGRSVCRRHSRFLNNQVICAICLSLLCRLCGVRLSIGSCPICGRLMCSECSIQLTPVHRVCKECYNKYGKEKVLRILGIARGSGR